jgi:hypothetical protein
MLPTVKPAFLRRTVSFAFGEAGIPPGVFASPPSFGVHWDFWIFLGFSTYPSGLWGFLGFRFSFHRKEAPGYAYLLQVTATGWGLSTVEDLKANPSLFGESMDLSELSNGASVGKTQKTEDSPEYAWSILVPFVLLLYSAGPFFF